MDKALIFKIFFAGVFLLTAVSCSPPPTDEDDDADSKGLILVDEYKGTESIMTVKVYGGYLYAAAGEEGVLVFDISNPSNMTRVKKFKDEDFLPVNTVDFERIGGKDYAFLGISAGGEGGIAVLEVTDGTNFNVDPAESISEIDVAGHFPVAIVADTARVYTADKNQGVMAYDLNFVAFTAAADAGFAAFDLFNKGASVAIDGDNLFIAARDHGVFILNKADASTVSEIYFSLIDVNSLAVDGTAGRKRLIVADTYFGVIIYNIMTAATPKLIGRYSTLGEARDVIVNGDEIYVADGSNGVLWIDKTTETSPRLKGEFQDAVGFAYNLDYDGGFVYVAYGPNGIKVLQKESGF
jgi:hypothetical protein